MLCENKSTREIGSNHLCEDKSYKLLELNSIKASVLKKERDCKIEAEREKTQTEGKKLVR